MWPRQSDAETTLTMSNGVVSIRECVRIRHTTLLPNGFPIGRAIRVVLLNDQVVGLASYWPQETAYDSLEPDERKQIILTATRLKSSPRCKAVELKQASRMVMGPSLYVGR